MTVGVGRRVGFVVPSLARGGAERQVVALAGALTGWQRQIIYFESQNDLEGSARHSGVSVLRVPRRQWFDVGLVRRLANALQQERPGIIHATGLFAGAVTYHALSRFASERRSVRVPFVITVHSMRLTSARYHVHYLVFYRSALRRADRVVFVCDAQRDYWCARMPSLRDRSVTIHNAISSRFLSAGCAAKRAARSPQVLQVVCVANLHRYKGHHVLIEAMRLLRGRVNVRVSCIGSGPAEKDLRRAADEDGLRECVTFLGAREDVLPALLEADVFVLPSLKEAFPVSILEAGAAGLPVVATDVGGVGEVITDGRTGLLVRSGDARALADALERLAHDQELRQRLGKELQAFVQGRFRVERMAGSYEELFGEEMRRAGISSGRARTEE